MGEVDISQATMLAAIVIGNIAGIIGAFVSLKVGLARVEVKVDKLEVDVNNLGGKFRQTK